MAIAAAQALASGAYTAEVDASLSWCQQAGITGVPFIRLGNGEVIHGAQPVAVMQMVLESALLDESAVDHPGRSTGVSLQLCLLRHAKSSWADPGSSDRERELNQRGLRDAPRMGLALGRMLQAQKVSVSPARRAQMTLQGLCQGWPAMAELEHRTEEELYTFSMSDLLGWIRGQDAAGESLFLIGHNPGLTELTNYLCGRARLDNLPTAGLVQFALDIDRWSELGPDCAETALQPVSQGAC